MSAMVRITWRIGVRTGSPRQAGPGAIDIGNFGHADVLSTFGGSKKGGVI